jgi:3-dehydroquinate dehydratase-2
MNNILVINGPNLNLLGLREPQLYGFASLAEINQELQKIAAEKNYNIIAHQSNSEEKIIDILQQEYLNIEQKKADQIKAIIINAAAYTHSSLAILDSLNLFSVPVVEVHLTDPKKRETYRHFSYIEQVAKKTFAGEGKLSYIRALKYVLTLL